MEKNRNKMLGMLVLLTGFTLQASAKREQPNFLIIQVDDMGYDDLAINGNTVSHTPHLDGLAEQSVRFGNFMVNSVCAPTRASLLTGRDFWKTGISGLHGGKDFMNLDETTFANVFQDNGYATGMWGKWHSGKADGYWPWDRGFDEAYYAKLYHYYPSNGWYNSSSNYIVHKDKWSPEVITDYTIDFISRNKRKPFLAYVSFLTCHDKWAAPETYIQKYRREGRSERFATLLGMLDLMDAQVGRLLQHLEDLGLDKNTVVVFLSDNGPNMGDSNATEWALRNNHGYKGQKSRLWQNGIKSPLYIRWKDHFQAMDVDRLVTVTDLFPTFLDVADLKIPAGNKQLDGRSVKPYLEGDLQSLEMKKAIMTTWFPVWEGEEYQPVQSEDKQEFKFDEQRMTMITEDFKLLLNPVSVDGAPYNKKGVILIDLQHDPMESRDVSDKYPDKVLEMKAEMQHWFSEVVGLPGSFSFPEFQIGLQHYSDVLAYGPCFISGVENDAHVLKGFGETGDLVEYALNVQKKGKYKVYINVANAQLEGVAIKVSCNIQSFSQKLYGQKAQELGEVYLIPGKQTFSVEVIDGKKNTANLGELKQFRFRLLENN